jgi:hypothetical protein
MALAAQNVKGRQVESTSSSAIVLDFASNYVVLTCLQAQSDGLINTSSKGGCVLTVKSL